MMRSTLLLLLLATPALAIDGVLEINQTCAVQTGCFAGDAASWPVQIDGSAGRSYRLTSDLVLPDSDTTGVKITTDDISIDLNNFAIISAACVATQTIACRPTVGSGFGVGVDNDGLRTGTSVRNGSITGMGSLGVYVGSQAVVTGLRVRWSRQDGIFAISSTVSGNTAHSNAGDGIVTDTDCLVQRNSTVRNTGWGLRLGNASAYRENAVKYNTAGTVTGGGTNMGSNSYDGMATCP